MIDSVREYNKKALRSFLAESSIVPEEVANDIIRMLEGTDFYEAPASTQYHGAYPGGLFSHSMLVAQLLVDWTEKGLITWERSWSPILVGLLHDFTKVGKYSPIQDPFEEDALIKGYEYNPSTLSYGGHGSDSCIKILQHLYLSEEETLCIRYHMGAYEKEDWKGFERAIQRYQTVLWTHHADMVTSKVLGV